jgi:hypothetical protein
MVTVLFLVAVGAVAGIIVYALGKTAPLEDTTGLSRISVSGVPVYVKIADTEALRERGLSGTVSLPANQGMLFMFDREGYYAMWMKDMRYSLDIIWISEQGIIVHIEKNLSPDTYPQAFTSTEPARTILELPAGFTDSHHTNVGDHVTIY